MTRIAKILSRFKFELSGRIIQTAAATGLVVLLARLLDPDSYGLLMLAISVFSFANLFTKLGIAESGARYIAEYKDTNPSQIPNIISSMVLINLIPIVLTVVVFILGHQLIADTIGEPDLVPFLLYGSLYLVSVTLVTLIGNILQGHEAIKTTAKLFTVEKIVRLLVAVGLVVLGFGAFGAFVGYIVGSVLVVVIGTPIIYYRYYRNRPEEPIESGLRRRIAEYSLPLTATKSASKIDKQLDTILVGFFLTPVAVGYYAIGKQVVEFIDMPVKALGFTVSPAFGSMKSQDNIEKAAEIYHTALENTLLLYIPAVAGLIVIAEPTVTLLFGSEYHNAVTVVQLMSIYGLFSAITSITSKSLDFMGRARARAIAKSVTAIGNVLLNIILIPTIGVEGAAIATVLSYGTYMLVNVYFIHTEFDLHLRDLFRKITAILLISSVMSAVVLLLASQISGFITLFLVVILGASIWCILSVTTGLLEYEKLVSAVI